MTFQSKTSYLQIGDLPNRHDIPSRSDVSEGLECRCPEYPKEGIKE